MTKSISSRSAKVTTKATAPQAGVDEYGLPPTGPSSETISGPSVTRWYITHEDGSVAVVTLEGRGRISLGANGSARIYRSATSKVYDAVISHVSHVVSDAVHVERTGEATLSPHRGRIPAIAAWNTPNPAPKAPTGPSAKEPTKAYYAEDEEDSDDPLVIVRNKLL